ncbi:hypothetical protein [Catellatospora coxensis]|uniref:Uncharacterized protein n=1 Tax=Catellatospora coxensis TaxID=310354 RepID=A0A8J3L3U0_9ACTN|nr:hypothetical protein [Catellatospora coxensis]GIG10934.1 hypothetical protein Cco03nite_76340 [Catellatospora coxensis]
MTTRPDAEPRRVVEETALSGTSEAESFDEGMQAAFDPRAAMTADKRAGHFVTTIATPWHSRFCTGCGHTFRIDDRVVVDDAGDVRHLDPLLGCAHPAGASPDLPELADFTAGMLDAWPAPDEVPLTSTDDVPFLARRPPGGFERMACLFCGHTFRPAETVVLCPCRPTEQLCRAAVHRDPVRGLVCWESWRPGQRVKVCPVMLLRLDT